MGLYFDILHQATSNHVLRTCSIMLQSKMQLIQHNGGHQLNLHDFMPLSDFWKIVGVVMNVDGSTLAYIHDDATGDWRCPETFADCPVRAAACW